MVITLFSCPNIEQDQWNTWVSFTSADSPLVGQFSVSVYTHHPKKQKGQSEDWPKCLILLVGAAGFELATPCTP